MISYFRTGDWLTYRVKKAIFLIFTLTSQIAFKDASKDFLCHSQPLTPQQDYL